MRSFVLLLAVAFGLGVISVGHTSAANERVGASLMESDGVNLLETWIESVLDFDRLPGMTIAMVRDQELVYANGFGHADTETGERATPGTAYSICSISKLFTSIATMQLRDAGKLSLDDPVSRHLSWFEPQGAESDAVPPTIRDLLRHSGGLPCEPDHTVWEDPELLHPDRDGLVERAAHVGMSYPSNETHNYSNLGYSLLGEIVSVVSGLDYEDYIRERILEPLGMDETTANPPEGSPDDSMATGYGRWPRAGSRSEIPRLDARALTPALGFSSTVEDMARFAMWQFRVLAGEENDVLSPATLREMQTEQWSDPSWGLGFTIWDMGGVKFVGHQGGCPGFKSQLILCPEESLAVIVMVNATDAPQFTLAFRAYEIVSHALEGFTESERSEQEDWDAYTGSYTADRSWSEAEVLEWNGSLAVMWVPTGNPVGSLVTLKRVGTNTFRQLNGDGSLGKHYVFKSGADGEVVAMKFNNNILMKIGRPE